MRQRMPTIQEEAAAQRADLERLRLMQQESLSMLEDALALRAQHNTQWALWKMDADYKAALARERARRQRELTVQRERRETQLLLQRAGFEQEAEQAQAERQWEVLRAELDKLDVEQRRERLGGLAEAFPEERQQRAWRAAVEASIKAEPDEVRRMYELLSPSEDHGVLRQVLGGWGFVGREGVQMIPGTQPRTLEQLAAQNPYQFAQTMATVKGKISMMPDDYGVSSEEWSRMSEDEKDLFVRNWMRKQLFPQAPTPSEGTQAIAAGGTAPASGQSYEAFERAPAPGAQPERPTSAKPTVEIGAEGTEALERAGKEPEETLEDILQRGRLVHILMRHNPWIAMPGGERVRFKSAPMMSRENYMSSLETLARIANGQIDAAPEDMRKAREWLEKNGYWELLR